jgi:signal transduction histidine kinase
MDNGNANILMVDDRPDKLLALEASLEDLQLNIVRAYSGPEALRHVLSQEFAVILLDINMPNMDGFETAEIIRQRRGSAHVPIIFLTAMLEDTYVQRSYSLGAVDYILTPVVPQVLRSKVGVFVDLFKKTQQVRVQAEGLRQRATQLYRLTDASVAIHSADTVEKVAQIAMDTARQIIGAHQAMMWASYPPMQPVSRASYSSKYPSRQEAAFNFEQHAAHAHLRNGNKVTRMSRHELRTQLLVNGSTEIGPPLKGLLAVPLSARDGRQMGWILVSDRISGDFTDDDQAILLQLGQMASVAIENILFAQERQANRFKDEFLATLSHELRTPLNAISGWVQLLRLNGVRGEVAHGLDVIDRNVKSQTKLIEDLLDLSRITSGHLRLNKTTVPARSILEAAVEALRPLLTERGIALICQIDGDGLILGDSDRLQQVFGNLLSNAAKFTPAGGTITVSARANESGSQISIADTGVGIDPQFLPHVFDRFRQADSSSSRRHGGLGIGLTIVHCIVEQHGGTVTAHSPGKGRGSTFTINLPPGPTDTAGPRTPIRVDLAGQLPTLASVRVLLVDDDADAREVVAEMLQRHHATVSKAESAERALELVDSIGPDILVTDLAMPERDGFSLLRDLRRLPPDRRGNIPAIALTAYARPEDRAKTFAAGFHAHLSKPVDPDALVMAIHHCVGRSATSSVATLEDTRPDTESN